MRQRVSILVILSGKALGMVFACDDGTLLRSFALVSQHVSLEILEDLSAVGIVASSFLILVTAVRTLLAVVRLMR